MICKVMLKNYIEQAMTCILKHSDAKASDVSDIRIDGIEAILTLMMARVHW